MKPKTIELWLIVLLLLYAQACKKSYSSTTEIIETQPALLLAHTIHVSDQIGGFYSALPLHYQQTVQAYPLLVWIHGNGQVGNGNADLPKVLYGGVPKLLNDKLFPPYFLVNGRYYSFIVLAPQFTTWPGDGQVQAFLDYAIKNYRVDQSRIYLSGLSMGGIVSADFAAGSAAALAAIVPVAGVSISGDIREKCSGIAAARLPVWIFQNTSDVIFDAAYSRAYVSIFNSLKPAIPVKYTELPPFGENGHDAWTMATDPGYRENNMNIYEWMLQYHR